MKLSSQVKTGLLGVIAVVVVASSTVHADVFNQNRIIDDGVFDNASTMSSGQIDTFLNGFASSCISLNNGFRAIDPTGYNPSVGYQYGGYVSAGQVIYDAAQAYSINPQVLITTLEKEQSLVTGRNDFSGYCNNGDQHKYAAAVGYGCPDSGTTYSYSGLSLYQRNGVVISDTGTTCVNSASKAGFSQQVIRAAWLLKFGEQRSEGNTSWAVIKGNWDNSDDPQTCYGGPMTQGTFARCPSGGSTFYDGYTTIDSTSVHIDTGATAALYWYTPHFHGNQIFVSLFTGWFGGVYAAPYSASYVVQSAYPSLYPGQTATVYFEFQNFGANFWKDDLTSFPGAPPIHMATAQPINRTSSFYDSSWKSTNRPTGTLAAVYKNDGSTLTSDQHTVFPGQIGKFSFTVRVSANQPAGVYSEYFQPIAEGSANWDMGGLVAQNITVLPLNQAGYVSQSSYPTLGQGQSGSMYFRYKNTGNTTWRDDAFSSSSDLLVHLATTLPINRVSPFYDSSWLALNRPAGTFSKVLQSDGTTLASNQHEAQPGQIIEFNFKVTAGTDATPGNYREYFQPVLEGSSAWAMGGLVFQDVTVTGTTLQATYSQQSSYPSIAKGATGTLFFTFKNSGTASWRDDISKTGFIAPIHLATSQPINRSSQFYDTSWLTTNRPSGTLTAVYQADGTLSTDQHTVLPGQYGKYSFTIKASGTLNTGMYREYFQPIAEGAHNWNIGGTVFIDISVTN